MSDLGADWLVWVMAVPLAAMLLAMLCGAGAASRVLQWGIFAGAVTIFGIWKTLESDRTALVYHVGGWAPPLGIAMWADGASLLLLIVTLIVVGAVAWCVPESTAPRSGGRGGGMFWVLLAGVWLSMNAVALGRDLFNLYVAIELLTFSAVPMVALGGKKRGFVAGLRYLLFALAGSVLYLLGASVIYGCHGTLDLGMLSAVYEMDLSGSFALGLIISGLAIKTALFPLHVWLPPAHGAAPAAASALLSGLVVKGSFFIALRIWFLLAGEQIPAGSLLAACGAAAVLVGGVVALRQRRLKPLIAWSTVAQTGYLFLIFPFDVQAAYQVGMMQLTAHAFAKAALFLGAGMIIVRLGHDRLSALRGLIRVMPVTVLSMVMASVSLVGVPPSGGFAAKWLLIRASIESGLWAWALVPLAGGLLASGYLGRALAPMLASGEMPGVERTVASKREWGIFGLALASMICGLWSQEILGLLQIGAGWELMGEVHE